MAKPQIECILGQYYPLLAEIAFVGRKILPLYYNDFDFSIKEDQSKITEADKLSNRLLSNFIQKKYPDHAIVSEENENAILQEALTFVIDPLDGTNDFVNKTGEFSIMVSVLAHKQPILGIVYVPMEKKMIFAKKGKGCYRWQNNRLDKLEIKNKTITKAAISRNHFSNEERTFCLRLGIKEKSFFPLGSIGLKISRICENSNDFYINFSRKLGIWDVAPNDCILREANGVILDENLEEITIDYSKTTRKVEQKIIFMHWPDKGYNSKPDDK